MNHDSKHPVTLDDLLRLKRAERPPAAFWDQFERELRAKQLSALLPKTPWWRRVSRGLGGLFRYPIPLGATAVLALTFLSVREYQSIAGDHEAQGVALASAAEAPFGISPGISAEGGRDMLDSQATLISVGAPDSEESAGVTRLTEGTVNPPVVLALGGASDGIASRVSHSVVFDSPSNRSIAANLSAIEGDDMMGTRRLMSSAHEFGSKMPHLRAPVVEPLAQMPSPSEARVSRLLTMVASSNRLSELQRDQGRRLDRGLDERLTDEQVRRFGARGDRVKFKF